MRGLAPGRGGGMAVAAASPPAKIGGIAGMTVPPAEMGGTALTVPPAVTAEVASHRGGGRAAMIAFPRESVGSRPAAVIAAL